MFYLIYQIRNKTNNKIYIGKHQTENKDDGYMGSGKFIKYAIEKEGIENFEKTILFECQSEEEMTQKEAEIVNEDFINSEDTYNVALGGGGGWNYINSHRSSIKNGVFGFVYANKNGLNNIGRIGKKMSEYQKLRIKEGLIKAIRQYPEKFDKHGPNNPMFGKHHSSEAKTKIRESHLGENNSQYGKMWICNDETHESKRILKTDIIPDGWRKGRFCK